MCGLTVFMSLGKSSDGKQNDFTVKATLPQGIKSPWHYVLINLRIHQTYQG